LRSRSSIRRTRSLSIVSRPRGGGHRSQGSGRAVRPAMGAGTLNAQERPFFHYRVRPLGPSRCERCCRTVQPNYSRFLLGPWALSALRQTLDQPSQHYQRCRQKPFSSNPLPPSPPAEKATAREDQEARKASTGHGQSAIAVAKAKRADRRRPARLNSSSKTIRADFRRRADDGVAPRREDHRKRQSGRAGQHRRWGRGPGWGWVAPGPR